MFCLFFPYSFVTIIVWGLGSIVIGVNIFFIIEAVVSTGPQRNYCLTLYRPMTYVSLVGKGLNTITLRGEYTPDKELINMLKGLLLCVVYICSVLFSFLVVICICA